MGWSWVLVGGGIADRVGGDLWTISSGIEVIAVVSVEICFQVPRKSHVFIQWWALEKCLSLGSNGLISCESESPLSAKTQKC